MHHLSPITLREAHGTERRGVVGRERREAIESKGKKERIGEEEMEKEEEEETAWWIEASYYRVCNIVGDHYPLTVPPL